MPPLRRLSLPQVSGRITYSSTVYLGLIRFGGRVDYVDRVSSSFVEESLQAFGGVEISICRSLVAAAERPGVI